MLSRSTSLGLLDNTDALQKQYFVSSLRFSGAHW